MSIWIWGLVALSLASLFLAWALCRIAAEADKSHDELNARLERRSPADSYFAGETIR